MGGCTLQVEMAQLGAEGVLDTPHIPELPAGQLEQAPGAGEAVGGRVTVHFAGVGVWCRGEVLAYDPTREVSSDKLQPDLTHQLSSFRICMLLTWHEDLCTGCLAHLSGDEAVSLSCLDQMGSWAAMQLHNAACFACRCTMSCTRMARTSGCVWPRRPMPGCPLCPAVPTLQACHLVRLTSS